MPHTLRYLALVPAFALACSRGEASPRSSSNASNTGTPAPTVAAASAGATAPTAGTSPAPAGMPHDTLSDRADRGRIMGDSTATLWVIMASDFQCPFCKQWHDAKFADIMQNYATKGRVRLAFLNYPLGQHQNALPAAEAAMCASVQGKFWPVHEGLFATQPKWETMQDATPIFDSLAVAAAVNMGQYRQCVKQHLTLPLIQADRDRGRAAGVASTPTFFVGDQVLASADADVHGAIEAALAKAGGAKKP